MDGMQQAMERLTPEEKKDGLTIGFYRRMESVSNT